MKLRYLARLATIVVASIAVAACSTTGSKSKNGGSGNYGDENGVTTMGLGDSGQTIGGYGTSDAYRLRGGANQIYFFDFNSNDVNSKYVPSLNAQSSYVLSHSSAHILLTGNTDERGSREYNIALGNRRAVAVANMLKSQGVAASKVRVVSYGAEKPIAAGHDEHSWAVNRNVQLIYEAK